MNQRIKEYKDISHRFNYAAWCASTAASASPKCRFSVKIGRKILAESSCKKFAAGWSELPSHLDFDARHKAICIELMNNARELGLSAFSYGLALKMLNIYLKTLFISGCTELLCEKKLAIQSIIHPPIDRLLLAELEKKDVGSLKNEWRIYKNKGWSTYNQEDYLQVIKLVKQVCGEEPLWKIEAYWAGHQ